MGKLPLLSGKEVIKALSRCGFTAVRQKGSHVILVKGTQLKKLSTVVPLHKEIDKGTLLEIMRQAGLTREEFLELL
ncbi:MAG TPA: type II toxin-antitoxin system HicA family toxin [Candidatus Nanoarchaeia archaeon]|nr:type II toxin-antitoxin system HicA family toxin [Candidatus Nanoarchaeia archaeon]